MKWPCGICATRELPTQEAVYSMRKPEADRPNTGADTTGVDPGFCISLLYTASNDPDSPPYPYFHAFSPIQPCSFHTSHNCYHSSTFGTPDPTCHTFWHWLLTWQDTQIAISQQTRHWFCRLSFFPQLSQKKQNPGIQHVNVWDRNTEQGRSCCTAMHNRVGGGWSPPLQEWQRQPNWQQRPEADSQWPSGLNIYQPAWGQVLKNKFSSGEISKQKWIIRTTGACQQKVPKSAFTLSLDQR